ncbi:MAG: Calx-beta domain-containing protein, partial [Cyanobacteria bacterium P01_F01_bin.86]
MEEDFSAIVSIAGTANPAEPGTNGIFTVTLSNPSETDTVIAYDVTSGTGSDGGATLGADYTISTLGAALSGEVTIPAGQTTATIDVTVADDTTLESDETIEVTLNQVTSGNEGITIDPVDSTAVLTIADDDSATVSIETTADAAEAGTNGAFTVTLSNPSTFDTVITYSVAGSAIADSDYTALSGEVTIPAGETSATLDVAVLDDTFLESTETVDITLTGVASGDANVAIDAIASSASLNLADDDSATVSIATTTEAAEPLTNGAFTVTLSQATETDTVIAYTVAGDALAGTDYTALSGEVTILAGQTTATIDVDVLDDTTLESAETVEVTLTSITSGNENITVDPVA